MAKTCFSSNELKLRRVADFLRSVSGWRRSGLAVLFGAITALAYAPINFFPVLWISFPALIFLLQGTQTRWQAFLTAWAFAWGAFVFGFYWIAASMFVDLAHFWWAVPLSVAGLPAFFALYYGIAGLAAQSFGTRQCYGVLAFALLWFLGDYARGNVFGGFPWSLEGYAWGRVLPVLQSASLLGIYGLTLITIICACLPALLVEETAERRIILKSSFALLIVMALAGEWRLAHASDAVVPDVRLRLVQPAIDQAHKWLTDERETHFRELLDYSSAPSARPITHIIWPETASTYYLAEDAAARYAVAAHTPPNGVLLTGVVRRSLDALGMVHYYNSSVAVDSKARIIAGYDKSHLVPFGEFIPLRRYLPLKTLVNGIDFTHGDGPHSLRVPNLPPFSPLICYEAIFEGHVVDPDDRPQFIVNLTNDGWYGDTTGPYQHFAMIKLRAIEEGLPLVRAANTGISGVIDGYGRVTARLGLGRKGFIDVDLPQALPPTFFSQHGETLLWLIFLGVTLIAAYEKRKSKIRK